MAYPQHQHQQGGYPQQQQPGGYAPPAPVHQQHGNFMINEGEWNSGLCNCTEDGPSCLEAFFCCYCQNGFQHSMMGAGLRKMDVGYCALPCILDVLCCWGLMGVVVNNLNRRRATELFAIQDGCCKSFAQATFCPFCSVAQVHRELTIRSMFPGGMCVKPPEVPQVQEMNGMGPSSQPPPPGQQQQQPVWGQPVQQEHQQQPKV